MVRGEPGVGKTVLLDYLAGRASECLVARAAGVQSEMELAFAGLHQLCAPMLDHAEALPVPQREALRTAFGLSAGPVPDRFLVGLATDWALGTEARSRALLSEGETAENGYREAIERLGRTRMRPAVARVHLYGEWLRRENRRRDARAELRTAHGLFTTMGIEAFAERARRELLATGDTVRKPTAKTVSELTAQEAHIARLAVDGETNVEIGTQLFLSTRTVEWHLSKVYTKLGVGSRRELRRALASLGQADPRA